MLANDAWCAVAELAASQHGAFHRRQAAELHLSNKSIAGAVRTGRIQPRSRDVFVMSGSSPSWKQELSVQSLFGSVVSHRSAARLHGLDGFTSDIVEVCREANQGCASGRAVVHKNRAIGQTELADVDGIRCTSIAATLLQLGAVVSPARVEQALDSALRQGSTATSIAHTLDELRRSGRNGCGVLALILDDPARSGALPDSWFERRLTKLLVDGGLPEPKLQHSVGCRRLDLAFPDVKLGIEAHSRRFNFGRRQVESDDKRDMELALLGWELVYVTWSMSQDPASLVRQIALLYRSRLASS